MPLYNQWKIHFKTNHLYLKTENIHHTIIKKKTQSWKITTATTLQQQVTKIYTETK